MRAEVPWLALLTAADLGALAFLVAQHAFVSMWVESGLFENIGGYFAMFGMDKQPMACWIQTPIGQLPLSFDEYAGVAIYAYAPFAYLWIRGLTDDPYVYRYLGIALFAVNAFLFYALVRQYVGRALSFLGALVFLTGPALLLTALTDHQSFAMFQFVLLLAGLAWALYMKKRSPRALLAAGVATGVLLLVRFEVLLWPVAAVAFYALAAHPRTLARGLAAARPSAARAWRARPSMAWIVLLGASLAVGALAVIRSDVFLAPAAAATARFQADHQIISRWIQRLADDPHIDQCLGISLFTINVLLFFGLARQYVARAVALVGARAFVPGFVLLLVALTDSRSFAVFQVVLLIAGLAWRHYLNNRSRLAVASASVAIGALCLVRIEVLLWTAAAAAISAAVFVFLPTAPSGSVARTWREVPKTLRMTLVGAAGFYLGSSPTLVYQATCSQNVFAVIRDRVLVNSVAAGAAPVTEKIATRLQQFWTENLLSQLPPYEISTPNVLLGLFAGLALTALLVHSVRSRRPHILLALVAVSLLLSIVTTGDLRYEHLLFLQLFVVLALLAGLRLAAGPRPGLVGAALLVVAVGNAATLYLDWRNWTDSVPVKQTMLNQSDPVALHAFLQAHYPGEEIWTTNVGLPNYLLYMSRGELSIHDIASWTTIGDTSDSIIDSGFGKQVSIPLQQMDKQRVIVAVSPVRDGSVGSIPRTRALYEILDWYQVPFHVDHVTSWRNAELYDIVVLDRGASPAEQGVLDVSVSSVSVRHAPGGGLVGSIAGEGFERGDVVMVDGVAPALTAFGSSESITFTVPGSERSTLTFQVFRPGTTKKSQVVSAPVQ